MLNRWKNSKQPRLGCARIERCRLVSRLLLALLSRYNSAVIALFRPLGNIGINNAISISCDKLGALRSATEQRVLGDRHRMAEIRPQDSLGITATPGRGIARRPSFVTCRFSANTGETMSVSS
jgi:hypothetical protein